LIDIQYDPQVDALAVSFRRGAKSARMVKVSNSVNVDFDSKGRLIALELLGVSWHLDPKTVASLAPAKAVLTLTQAERESGLRASTLRGLLNRGRLEGDKRGRDWFVDATALFNYMESREARGRLATNPRARRRLKASAKG
jgi:uncharacterized protein YuzE